MKRPQLINNEIYHIVIRGTGNTKIFRDQQDKYRAVFSLYEFNTSKAVVIREKRGLRNKRKLARGATSGKFNEVEEMRQEDDRDLLVEILAFYFMPNHVHLLLRQLREGSITQFMRKLGTGYAYYFNEKYNRKGHLFQGRFKVVHIKDIEQLKNVFVYIHTNGISFVNPRWKEEGVSDVKKVIEFLENDKWSSYSDYIGKYNFPSVTSRVFLLDAMGGVEGCKNFIKDWIEYKKELKGEMMALE